MLLVIQIDFEVNCCWRKGTKLLVTWEVAIVPALNAILMHMYVWKMNFLLVCWLLILVRLTLRQSQSPVDFDFAF